MSRCRMRLTQNPSHRGTESASVSRCSETASGRLLDLCNLFPLHPRGGQDDALGQPVAAANLDLGVRKVQDLNHDLVIRAGIVGIDDPDAVGHLQTALERRAAPGENRQAMSAGNLDNESSADQYLSLIHI